MEVVKQKTDVFLGLNNRLHPSSPEYREGMAYRSRNARINEKGLWAAQQKLIAITDPPVLMDCPHGTTGHFKYLAVDNVDYVVRIGRDTICDVGPNKKLYSTNGSGSVKNAGGDIATLTRPGITSVAVDNDGASRMREGTYWYVATKYDTVYESESLPSVTAKSGEIDSGANHDYAIVVVDTEASATYPIRLYRSRVTNAASNVYSPTNQWYFVEEKTSGAAGATTFTDRNSDQDIANYEYEGRGSNPPTAIDYLVSYDNRMLYFKGNVLWWSSAGRPEEVAQEYTVTFSGEGGESVTCKPKLSTGIYGEAYTEIAELSGHTVLAAKPYLGKLYVWTSNLMGYIETQYYSEGYKFRLLREGVGVTSDKVLALSPYGLFGADKRGPWLINSLGTFKRLADTKIDLNEGQDTTFSGQDFKDAFGCWSPQQDEYLWGVRRKIIAYQVSRDIFVGPYDYPVSGGCTVVTDTGAHAYLTGGLTPSPITSDSIVQYLDFWLGQSAPTTIKDQVEVEIAHSETPTAEVTATLYQNEIASTAGAVSGAAIGYTASLGKVVGTSSGRFFMISLVLPTSGAPIAAINYKYNAIGWSKRYGR